MLLLAAEDSFYHPSATECPRNRGYAATMFRNSVVPPEVFIAHANKHKAARMLAMRDRLKLQMNMADARSKPQVKDSPADRPVAVAGHRR